MAAFALVERPEEGVVFAFGLADVVDDGIMDADVAEDTIIDVAVINCQGTNTTPFVIASTLQTYIHA
jgi:hypothetical protein